MKTHGLSYTYAYAIWQGMKARCYDPKSKSYRYYGALGIRVCDRWLNSVEAFYEDMGDPPPNMSIDRIDPRGDYEPSNCRWATAGKQSRNTRARIERKPRYKRQPKPKKKAERRCYEKIGPLKWQRIPCK